MTPTVVNDSGILICLTSLPFGEINTFREQIFDLFSHYKSSLLTNFSSKTEAAAIDDFRKYFYEPKAYYIFGDFDLAIISLIDDFEFGIRTFTPYNPRFMNGKSRKSEDLLSFNHQILFGATPKHLKDNQENTIPSKKFINKNLPLISISRLKISNSSLLTHGLLFLNSFIKAIQIIIDEKIEKNKLNDKFGYIIQQSLGWNEITLITFSTSYAIIFEILPKITELDINGLINLLINKNQEEGTELKRAEFLSRLYKEPEIKEIEKEHFVVAHASTTLGFSLEILDEIKQNKDSNTISTGLINSIEKDDPIEVFIRFFLKGGNLIKSIEKLNEIIDGDKRQSVKLSFGKSNILYTDKETPHLSNTLNLVELISKIIVEPSIGNYIRAINTVIAKDVNIIREFENKSDLYFENLAKFRQSLKRLCFSIEEITVLDRKLKELAVPKVLRECVVNMFGNFNNSVSDPVLYVYFFDFRPILEYLVDLVGEVRSESKGSHQLLIKNLDEMIHAFESAFSNRFHQNYTTGEITDYNIFFKGGIQQLLVVYAEYYKIVCQLFNIRMGVVFVEGHPSISASRLKLSLNFYHLFLPESCLISTAEEIANLSLMDIVERSSKKATYDPSVLDKFTRMDDNAKDTIIATMKKVLKSDQKIFSKYVHILKNITPEFFRHIFADFVTFSLTFCSDFNLFQYWYSGIFMSNHINYDDDGRINQDNLITFYLRLLCIHKLANSHDNSEFKFAKMNDCLTDEIAAIANDCNSFVNEILSKDLFGNWFEETNKFSQALIKMIGFDSVKKYSEYLRKNSIEIQKTFSQGGLVSCDIQKKNNEEIFSQCQVYIYSYLNLIYEKWYLSDEHNHTLTRNKDTGNPIINTDLDAYLLFDPHGGVFINDPLIRREYFKLRNTLLHSMWDLCFKNKEKYISELIN